MNQIDTKSKASKIIDIIQPFITGCFAGMLGIMIVQPFDMLKISIQFHS